MKIKLQEKCQNLSVTNESNNNVVRNAFINALGDPWVSILVSIGRKVPKILKKCKCFFNIWRWGIARLNYTKSNQSLGKRVNLVVPSWENFLKLWHFSKVNKIFNEKDDFSLKYYVLNRRIFLDTKRFYIPVNDKALVLVDRSKLILRCGDIEKNPGPVPGAVSGGAVKDGGAGEQLNVLTYNVRGLKEYSKLKRILNKCAGKMKKLPNTIFNYQETHLSKLDENKIKVMWRGEYVLSPGREKSRGCLTLFDSTWEKIDHIVDPGGRYTVVTLKKVFGTFTFINLYAPNEQTVDFFEEICIKAIDCRDRFDSNLVISGDFNLVINKEIDSHKRAQTQQEKIVSDFVISSFEALGLSDCYRCSRPKGGFTWSRGECLSRLDMIFASKEITKGIDSAEVDWAFDRSDHASLEVVIRIKRDIMRGPGLPKVDSNLLKSDHITRDIRQNLLETISAIPEGWDPHKKWEFVKVMLRSLAWEASGKYNKITKADEDALIDQINRVQRNKSLLAVNGTLDETTCNGLDSCINELQTELNAIWIEKSKKLALQAKIKWFSEGEKSNKYFLNILNKRRKETTINNLSNGSVEAVGQIEVQKLIKEFYEDLYAEREDLNTNYDLFYPTDLPKLNDADREKVDTSITLEELYSTIKSCGDSAPGPDGITYKFYEVFWDVLGPMALKALEYSKAIGTLPISQRRSTISLLPKEGKDLSQIGNWRPITLSNCDLKIFTKTIANRVANVLDKIISPTQTAYIPGRVVQDNLRMFEFYKNYCRENNVDAVLMSMDAKKAFDSVDHKYMFNTLRAYGFSEDFISTVKLLYKDIEADILVNGHRTVLIRIRRCVKQGDALSCALFIICIDPLLRNIEANKKILPIVVQTPLSNIKISPKTGAFADDVGTLIRFDRNAINEVFKEYKKFTSVSGIEINESKTEVLRLGNVIQNPEDELEISNGTNFFRVKILESIKICGITFSNNDGLAYVDNIKSKIRKMKKKILSWHYRRLTMGGKILVLKTFGISQLIYSMQTCKFNSSDLKEIETFIFTFLWTNNLGGNRAPDRIKRIIMKQDYQMGGLRVPDIKNFDSALKLKQYLRASKSNHPIRNIQRYITESLGYDYVVHQDYNRFSNLEAIVESSQYTLNTLTDKLRNDINESIISNQVIEPFKIDILAGIDIREFLIRNNKLLINGFYNRLFNCGIENFKQLVMEATFPRSDNVSRICTLVLSAFPGGWIDLIKNNITCNPEINLSKFMVINCKNLIKTECCTVKNIKESLLQKSENGPYPFERKLGFYHHPGINPFLTARIVNHSTNLKIFKFRLLHMDIFSKERMFKFKMSDNDNCSFCGLKETVRHVLWECRRANMVWDHFKLFLIELEMEINLIFENIFIGFNPTDNVVEALITRVTQILLRIDRENSISSAQLRQEILVLAKQNVRERNNITNRERWEKIIAKLNH